MEKIILLKTQLAVATKYAISKKVGHKRLAVILLDDFIELQLSGLLEERFKWRDVYGQDKDNAAYRNKILNNYPDLLDLCVNEQIINAEELKLLQYCHGIRYNLYVPVEEEKFSTQLAIIILHQIILKYQPVWKSVKGYADHTYKTVDPYKSQASNNFLYDGNSKQEWDGFLENYFLWIDGRSKSTARLISNYLLVKIAEVRKNLKFIRNDFTIFFPHAVNWTFNDFLLHYSFLNSQKAELEQIKKIVKPAEAKAKLESLVKKYEANWRPIEIEYLDKLEAEFKKIPLLSTEKSLEEFLYYKNEIEMIHETFARAASDLAIVIQDAIDIAQGQ